MIFYNHSFIFILFSDKEFLLSLLESIFSLKDIGFLLYFLLDKKFLVFLFQSIKKIEDEILIKSSLSINRFSNILPGFLYFYLEKK